MTDEEKQILLNEYYHKMQACLRERNFPKAAGYLYLIYNMLEFHPSAVGAIKFDVATERDGARMLQTYIREFEDDPAGYLRLMTMHYMQGRIDIVRKIWQDTCEKAVKGFHFQPSIQASVLDAEQGHANTTFASLGLGKEIVAVLENLREPDVNAGAAQLRSPPAAHKDTVQPLVQTQAGEPIGLDGVSLNGRIAGFSIPTRYYFRYGMAPDELTEISDIRAMPAGLHGYVRDTGENLFRRISTNSAELVFRRTESPEENITPSHKLPKVSMTLEWPFGKDRNHLNGIGIIDLLLGWTTQAHERGTVTGREFSEGYPTSVFPGEGLDLRDAVFTMSYRSEHLNAKAFSPVVWLHGRTGTAVFPETYDDLAAWAVTDDGMPKSFTDDGAWHRLAFALPGQSSHWTFCGSNTEEMGMGMARYTYAPIQQVQRDNVGGNVCVAFVHGFDLDTPEGSLEIAQLELTYRSRSLLGPEQEAVLLDLEGTRGEPGRLTDGSIGDLESCWISECSPDLPIDLIWRLRDDADIESFKLHQCVLAPANALEIALSQDGKTFQDVWQGGLVDAPDNPAEWGTIREGAGNVRVVILAAPVRARYVRLRVKSGHRQGVVGLDAFEVFGQGLPFIPSPDAFTFSENIENLERGAPIFAQLVAENTDGVFEGDIIEVPRPDRDVPYILSGSVIERHDDMARIALRTIAMGSMATLHVVLTSDQGEAIAPPPISIGKWTAARDVRVNVRGLKADVAYQVVCRAENANGTTEPFTFRCDAHG